MENMAKSEKKNTPLLHIVKRDQGTVTWYYKLIVRAVAILAAILVSGILITILAKANPIV